MELFVLKRINNETKQEEFLCVSHDTECSGYDSYFLRTDFDFSTREDIQKYNHQVYTTPNALEFENQEVESMDREDKNYIFNQSEFYSLVVDKVKI